VIKVSLILSLIILVAAHFNAAIPPYLAVIMALQEIAAMVVRKTIKQSAQSEPIQLTTKLSRLKISMQFLVASVGIVGFQSPIDTIKFISIFMVSTSLTLASGMQILLLALNRRNPKWLRAEKSIRKGSIGLPNWISIVRLSVAPIIPYIVVAKPFDNSYIIAIAVTFVAVVSDFFDGLIARKTRQATKAGENLDMLSDKITFGFCLVGIIIASHSVNFYLIAPIIIHDVICVMGFLLINKQVRSKMKTRSVDKIRFGVVCVWLLLASLTFQYPALSWVTTIALIVASAISLVALGDLYVRYEKTKKTVN
jgi:CDP-diacylglycerol--glycerol-3-phosphate 3-phosphatidyltransferase